MSRIKTGGRGFEFSRREIEIAWADTKAELDEESRSRREKANSKKPETHESEAQDNAKR